VVVVTIHGYRRVFVFVDGSEASLPALDVAAVEASMRRLPLHVVRGCRPLPGCGPATPGSVGRLLSAQARGRVMVAVARIADAYPDVTVRVAVDAVEPASTLIEAAEEGESVVVGHDRSAAARSALAEVVGRTGCPVIAASAVAHGRSGPAAGPVVVGVTGLDRDASVIAFAFDEASLRGVALYAVHVWLNIPEMELASVDPFVYDLAEARRDADRLLQRALDGWADKFPHVPVLRLPKYQIDVAAALSEASAGAGLLVLGSFPRGGPGGWSFGPLAGTLIGHLGCPVAVVRSR